MDTEFFSSSNCARTVVKITRGIFTTVRAQLDGALSSPSRTDFRFFSRSPNFYIIPDFEQGLLFKNKRDRKIICVDPRSKDAGDNSKRHEIKTSEYVQVVLFDHMDRLGGTQKKS